MTLFLCNFYYVSYTFFHNKACNWSIGFLQIVNISKLYHILGSNHSTFYVSFHYKFLVLKMRTLLLTKYMWKTITFHCLPSSRCNITISKSCYPLEVPIPKTFLVVWQSAAVFMFSSLVRLGLCCCLVPCCLFIDCTSRNEASTWVWSGER
jgi:hypothetical protein